MAKLSKQTKEIIKTVIFLVVVGLLLFYYVIYPLNRTEAMFARADIDDYNSEDTLSMNDPSSYTGLGMTADSFRIEADGITMLAALLITDSTQQDSTEHGTIIILHADQQNRDSVANLTAQLLPHSKNIVVYDQRACRLSSNRYFGMGEIEALDLIEMIRTLDIRGQLFHPLIVVGYEMGADAALLAALEEQRIDHVIAVDPYLTTDRLLETFHKKYDAFWFPFYKGTIFWWYERRSSYAPTYFELNDMTVTPVNKTLVIDNTEKDDDVIAAYSGMSSFINLVTYDNRDEIDGLIVGQLTHK